VQSQCVYIRDIQTMEGGEGECRTELSVANLVKTFHSICQAAPRLGSLQLIASAGCDKSCLSTPGHFSHLSMPLTF
jgi:hypothetical protein